MERWRGRVAFVTGASSGIGASLVTKLAEHGMEVFGIARKIGPIEELAKRLSESTPGNIYAISCDVTKEEDVKAAFQKVKDQFGGIDICVNGAGGGISAPLLSAEARLWDDMLKVNILGLSICTREAYKSMKEKGVDDGHIINIGSIAGHNVVHRPESHFYAATKCAVRSLTEGVRHELAVAKSNIKVSEVSPGLVKTEFHERMTGKTTEAADEWYQGLGKYLLPDDVADTIISVIATPANVQIHEVMLRHTSTLAV